jgi:hypothetical protein
MGNSNLNAVKNTENVVALCDVDWRYAKKGNGQLSTGKEVQGLQKDV